MRATAVIQGDHAAVVSGPLVGAHAEHGAHGPGQAQQEAAGGAWGVSLAHAVGVRAMITVVPALGGLFDTFGAQDPGAPQVELIQGDSITLLLAGGLPSGLKTLVGLALGQAIGAGDITGHKPIRPGDPGRRQQRILTGQELHFTNSGGTPARWTGQGHGPAPPPVAGHSAVEEVGNKTLTGRARCDVVGHSPGGGNLLQGPLGQGNGGGGAECPVLGRLGLLGGGGQGPRPLLGAGGCERHARNGC